MQRRRVWQQISSCGSYRIIPHSAHEFVHLRHGCCAEPERDPKWRHRTCAVSSASKPLADCCTPPLHHPQPQPQPPPPPPPSAFREARFNLRLIASVLHLHVGDEQIVIVSQSVVLKTLGPSGRNDLRCSPIHDLALHLILASLSISRKQQAPNMEKKCLKMNTNEQLLSVSAAQLKTGPKYLKYLVEFL